jgi:cytochrome c oxidase subunit 2
VEEPGIYRGQCAELCGKDHGFMPVVVQALPEDEYVAWVADQQAKNTPRLLPTQPRRGRSTRSRS